MQRFPKTRVRPLALACLAGAICLFGSLPALGGPINGGTPVWEPIVINQSGVYTVTRDITSDGVVFNVLATAKNTVINLDNWTIKRTTEGDVISVVGDTGSENSVTIENGTITVADAAAEANAALDALLADFVRVTDVKTNGVININEAKVVELSGVKAASIDVNGTVANMVTGSISDCQLVNSTDVGLNVGNGSAVRVKDISIENPTGDGLRFGNCDGCQASDVAVQDAGGTGVVCQACQGTRLWGITSFRSHTGYSIDFLSQGTFLHQILASFSTTGPGLDNQGSDTHVSGCTFNGNAGGGVTNTGSNLFFRHSACTGNASPQYEELGFMTTEFDNNCPGI